MKFYINNQEIPATWENCLAINEINEDVNDKDIIPTICQRIDIL